jgi:UDP-N-acetylmuramoyl-L-alanyl-D-glutamate--2,6-diaminopimelate ligase
MVSPEPGNLTVVPTAQPSQPSSPRTLAELLDTFERVRPARPGDGLTAVQLRGVAHDSRAVRPGDLYVGVPGASAHGATFAAQAAAAGAVALLTDEDGARRAGEPPIPVLLTDDVRGLLGPVSAWVYHEPSTQLALYGITGTNGKTTSSLLLDAGLRAAGRRTGFVGTVGVRVGERRLPSARTTPEAPELQALLADMLGAGVTAASMEVSSHALSYGRVAGTRFAAVGFTNLTQDHLDFYPDLEAYFQAKAALFRPEYASLAVVDVDGEHGRRLVGQARAAGLRVVTVSTDDDGDRAADWRAEHVQLHAAGASFTLRAPDGATHVAAVALPGRFNVANAVLALAMLAETGVDLSAALDGVAHLTGVAGRMERVDAGQPYLAVVDYAHTPDAVRRLLVALRPLTKGALRIVVGCGGDRDRGKRPLMGAATVELADEAVFTNDNPRSEDPQVILAAMRDGAEHAIAAGAGGRYRIEPDRAAAIRAAVAHSGPGDTVVIAGKGHEQGQEAGGVVRPFDDRAVLREAIEAEATTRSAREDGQPSDRQAGPR